LALVENEQNVTFVSRHFYTKRIAHKAHSIAHGMTATTSHNFTVTRVTVR